jgi:hypothetical protein
VWLAKDKNTGKKMALKQISAFDDDTMALARQGLRSIDFCVILLSRLRL